MTETIKAKGASKRVYVFTVNPKSAELPTFGGVYIVARKQGVAIGRQYNIIYIGKAENLRERHVKHHREKCFKLHGANFILFHACANEYQRRIIEDDLLAANDPPCNKE